MKAPTQAKQSETLQFTMHQNLLVDVIKRQAGTVSKAMLEAVQNSVDSGSTYCRVTLEHDRFIVEDDGRGFNGKEEIERVFGTFGQPHEANDATIGRYRMGRGQLMSFAVTTYDSMNFTMRADIRNKGLTYEFTDHGETIFKGCRVTCDLYNPLMPSDLIAMRREFREYAEYAPIPVTLNGTQINKLPSDMKWDVETDEFYLKIKEGGGVKVYNLGFFVRRYYEAHYGVSALVVSKKQLEVNFARNDILVSECQIWKQVTKELRSRGEKKAKKAVTLTDEGRALTIQQLITDELNINDFAKIKVFRDAMGKYYNLGGLAKTGKPLTVAPKDKHPMADHIQQSGLAIVLSPKVLDWFEVDNLKQVIDCLKAATQVSEANDQNRWETYQNKNRINGFTITDFKSLSDNYNPQFLTVDDKDLHPKELALLKDLRAAMRGFYYQVVHPHDIDQPERILMAGKADTSDYWTDGETFIAINKDRLKDLTTKNSGAFKILLTLAHQYAFNHDTRTGSMVCDVEFYERFMAFTLGSSAGLSDVLTNLQRDVFKTAEKHNITLNKPVIRALDALSKYSGESQAKDKPATDGPSKTDYAVAAAG